MKDENGLSVPRRETAHGLCKLAATSVPAEIADRQQMSTHGTAFPSIPRENRPAARYAPANTSPESLQAPCSGIREVKLKRLAHGPVGVTCIVVLGVHVTLTHTS